jgi:phage gp37-like protein
VASIRIKDHEDAILDRLREEVRFVRNVETFDGGLVEELVNGSIRRPAVLVALGNEEPGEPLSVTTAGMNVLRMTREWEVTVVSEFLREEGLRREDRGAYALIAAVVKALHNQKLGLSGVEEMLYLGSEKVVEGAVYGYTLRFSQRVVYDTTDV